MDKYLKDQIDTEIIQIPSNEIIKTKNINSYIKYYLIKNYEGLCNKNGLIIKDSINLVNRSIGKIITHNNQSKIEYNINYSYKILNPCKDDEFECIIDNITKMGIIAYLNDDNINSINDTPILFIIPNEYIEIDINKLIIKQKINIIIIESRIKFKSNQIQVVGKLTK